jgi:UDP-glucose 4-epimerase
MNTLIIGGAGFIGAKLTALLLESGRQVTVLGRKKAPAHSLPDGAAYCSGDFAQRDILGELLDRHQEVIHLAYATVPNTSFENPLADLLQNLPPTVQLFSEMAARDRTLLLVSSGGTVYGEAIHLPIREDHPTRPISPYGVTKLTLENYAHLYSVTHGLKYICVRPGNAYGEGQHPFAGQGFISTAMASAMRGKAIKIFGRSGAVRDYIHVNDLASGILQAMERGRLSEIYNIGSGQGYSTLDVIEIIRPLMREIGCEVDIEYLPERAFDVKANVLDAAKLQHETGWKPAINFVVGLHRTREWLRIISGGR